MPVPPPPPGASAHIMQQYYALSGQWTAAMNAGNTAQAQQIYNQMLALGQQVSRSPGILTYLQRYLQQALAFFGMGWGYIRLIMMGLGELIAGVVGAIFAPEFLAFIAICLLICLLYHWAMQREEAMRQRCKQAASSFQLMARLQVAHKAAFGLGGTGVG